MHAIHHKVLALVTGVFLIQAADPPSDSVPRYLGQLAYRQVRLLIPISGDQEAQPSEESLIQYIPYGVAPVEKVTPPNREQSDNEQPEDKNSYEKLIDTDLVKPLLKLYEKEIHEDPPNNDSSTRISKEDYVEDFRILSKEELDLLIHGGELYQQNEDQNFENYGQDIESTRRDDSNLEETNDNEHIGEILPSNFQTSTRRSPKYTNNNPFQQNNYIRTRKSFVNDHQVQLRRPMVFPTSQFRQEFDSSAISSEGRDSLAFSSEAINFFDSNTYNRIPRRLRGGRETYFDPSARYQTSWQNGRRPRVIFPSDLVSFRDQGVQNQDEVDWLAGDNSLQDLQETDARDRGSEDQCVPGATCEFFLSCWMGGGLVDTPCGLLRACCFRGLAKASPAGGPALGTLEAPREPYKLAKSQAFDEAVCGVSSSRQQAQRRIVGGEEAGFGTFPWQAYIRIGSSRCGGSLVSRKHVVTAGHCVARATPRQVHVTLGDYVINSAVEPLPAYTFGVATIQVHPLFKFTPQADRFDVAVLRLDRAALNLPHVTPICLPPKGENFLGEVGIAAGWGALSPGSRLRPQTLQAVQVPVIENRQCERWHRGKGIQVTIHDEMMCAGYRTGGRDSCQGDSGGPLMLNKAGRWFLIGIVSAGYSCAQPGQPGIYHRVAHTVDWIMRQLGS